MLEQIESWELEERSRGSAQAVEFRKEAEEIAAKLRRLDDLRIEGEIAPDDHRARKAKLVGEKIALEARIKAVASEGAGYWLEPLKDFVNAVWERNLPTAGGDLNELRDFVAEGGSNLSLNSRNVLWDWTAPYALLAERASCLDWRRRRDSNPRDVSAKRFSRPPP
jgi:hypothetical protein